MTQELGLCPAG